MAIPVDVAADAVAIINEWGDDVSFDGAATVKGVVTELLLAPDQPGFSAISFGGRGQARKAKLEIVSSNTTPAIGQKVTIGSTVYKVEFFSRRTWITEVELVVIEAV